MLSPDIKDDDYYASFPMFPAIDYHDDSPSPVDSAPPITPANPPPRWADHRRMSEPAVLAVPNQYAAAVAEAHSYNPGYTPRFTPSLHRGVSLSSLRQLRNPSPPSPTSSPTLSPDSPTSPNSKTYSFVSLPGNAVKKRPRRRYDEIERLYQCSYPDCTKSYGTLNHLNAHVTMQKHGPKRSPTEFKELRKQWRKAKKESEAASTFVARPVTQSLGSTVQMAVNTNYPQPVRRASLGNLGLGMGVQDHHSPGYAYSQPRSYQSNQPRFSVPLDSPHYSSQSPDHWPPQHHHHQHQQQHQAPAYQQQQHHHHHQYSSPSPPSPTTLPFPFTPGHQHTHSLPHIQSYARQTFDPLERGSQQQQPYSPVEVVAPRSHSHSPMNCLPPDSTLLTPLPGYESSANVTNTTQESGPPYSYDDDSKSTDSARDAY